MSTTDGLSPSADRIRHLRCLWMRRTASLLHSSMPEAQICEGVRATRASAKLCMWALLTGTCGHAVRLPGTSVCQNERNKWGKDSKARAPRSRIQLDLQRPLFTCDSAFRGKPAEANPKPRKKERGGVCQFQPRSRDARVVYTRRADPDAPVWHADSLNYSPSSSTLFGTSLVIHSRGELLSSPQLLTALPRPSHMPPARRAESQRIPATCFDPGRGQAEEPGGGEARGLELGEGAARQNPGRFGVARRARRRKG